jgi:hypothetical protein
LSDAVEVAFEPVRSPIPKRAGLEFAEGAAADPWKMNPTTASRAITNI